MFSLIYAWINGWVNNREAGNLRRHRSHYDVIVMHWERRNCNRLSDGEMTPKYIGEIDWYQTKTKRKCEPSGHSLDILKEPFPMRNTSCVPCLNSIKIYALQWRHNERDGVSDHHPHDCLLNRLSKAQIKENIKAVRHWPLCVEFTGDR